MFDEEKRNAAKMNRFNRLLHDGVAEDAAIKEAFGDLAPYHENMRTYVTRPVFGYARIPISAASPPESFSTQTLSPGEAAVLQNEFLVAISHPLEARAFAAKTAKTDPTLPDP
jgi:hypothetical protein